MAVGRGKISAESHFAVKKKGNFRTEKDPAESGLSSVERDE